MAGDGEPDGLPAGAAAEVDHVDRRCRSAVVAPRGTAVGEQPLDPGAEHDGARRRATVLTAGLGGPCHAGEPSALIVPTVTAPSCRGWSATACAAARAAAERLRRHARRRRPPRPAARRAAPRVSRTSPPGGATSAYGDCRNPLACTSTRCRAPRPDVAVCSRRPVAAGCPGRLPGARPPRRRSAEPRPRRARRPRDRSGRSPPRAASSRSAPGPGRVRRARGVAVPRPGARPPGLERLAAAPATAAVSGAAGHHRWTATRPPAPQASQRPPELPRAGGPQRLAAGTGAAQLAAHQQQPGAEHGGGVGALHVLEERRVDRAGGVVEGEEDDPAPGADRRGLGGDLDPGDEQLAAAAAAQHVAARVTPSASSSGA